MLTNNNLYYSSCTCSVQFTKNENGDAQQKEHLAVHEYLKACNSIFENGILSHTPIECSSSPVLKNIEVGYKYFNDWKDHRINYVIMFISIGSPAMHGLLNIGTGYKFSDPAQKHFLAWQVHTMLLFLLHRSMLLLDLGLTTNHAFWFQRIVHRLP